ncbi:putative reverse transcriptase domain-containing protein [Tanacetum coccineum]
MLCVSKVPEEYWTVLEKKEYAGTLPLCNRCKLHHNGQCTVKCGNCKKVGHMTQDCRNPAAARNQKVPHLYDVGLGHYKSDCPGAKEPETEVGRLLESWNGVCLWRRRNEKTLTNLEDEIELKEKRKDHAMLRVEVGKINAECYRGRHRQERDDVQHFLGLDKRKSVMSSDSAVTYTSVHSEARSWSIPSEDPYEEAARQLLEQAPRPSEYVPDPMELEDHVPVYIPEPEHPEDLVPAEDEAPIEAYITEVASAPTPPLPPPSFLPTLIRPKHTRAAMAQGRAAASSTYHSLLPAETPPLLTIPLPVPSTSRRADIPEADTPPWKRLLLTAPTPRFEVGESSAAAAARQPGSTMARRVDHSFVDTMYTRVRDTERRTMAAVEEAQEDRTAVRAEIEILRRERLAYEQESIETSQALARSEAYSRALEAQISVLETQVYRQEWQRQDTDDRAIEHIMRTQALEAGARVDTLEDTGSSA